MLQKSFAGGAIAVALMACVTAACSNEPEFAGADTQSVVARERTEPMTVAGCLRSGVGTNTFVLTTMQSAGQSDTATYNLTGAAGINLQQHVGHQVQVTGTLLAETQVTNRSGAMPQEKAAGTTGTPVVETKTEVDVKRFDVTAVTGNGQRCET